MKTCSCCGCENTDEAVRCRECGAEFGGAKTPEEPRPPKYEIKPLSEAEKNLDLVTIVSCRTLLEADMIKSLLEAEGISAMIPDEFLMQSISWPSTYGFVRVQVSPKDYETARNLLVAVEGGS